MKNTALDIAKLLIELECVQLCPQRPFTYASGLKGPIYCDNRKVLSHVDARRQVRDSFVELVREKNFSYDFVAGMATAGIAHAAFVAEALDKPMLYIRSKPKGHGKQNQVEGAYESGQEILLFEDLVNQGKSLGEGIDGARNAGLRLKHCFAIVDYQMEQSLSMAREKEIELHALTTFENLLVAGLELGVLDQLAVENLKKWQSDPANWSV